MDGQKDSHRVLAILVGGAGVNALVVFVALVGFGAPRLPVMIGCVWAVIGIYLLGRSLEDSRGRSPKRK